MRSNPSLLPLAALTFALAGCDSFYGVRGHVANCADHAALGGALVHMEEGIKRGDAVSAADGSYGVWANDPDGDNAARLTIAKPGFRTVQRDVPNPHVAQDVCLQPEASPAPPPSLRTDR
jgi:hypothetical protein